VNSGDVTATASTFYAIGISASGRGPIDIYNSSDVLATTSGRDAWGIIALTGVLAGSSIHIVNTGDLQVSGVAQGLGNIPTAGIAAQSFLAADSPIAIENEGALTVSALANAFGIVAYTSGANSPISIENRGDIAATGAAYGYGTTVEGIRAAIFGASSPVAIVNSGNLSATGIGAEPAPTPSTPRAITIQVPPSRSSTAATSQPELAKQPVSLRAHKAAPTAFRSRTAAMSWPWRARIRQRPFSRRPSVPAVLPS
jgi:hypothetical protein